MSQPLTVLALRTELIALIRAEFEAKKYTQEQMADLCSTTQPRVSALLAGKGNIATDRLIEIVIQLGLRPHFKILS